MTVRPLVLLEVFDPLVERPCDVCRPIKADSIEGRDVLVGQLLHLALAGIITRMPRLGAEFEEGFVLGNRNVGMAMRLLIPLQVLHSIVECLVLASRLWCLLLLLLLLLPSVLLLLLLSLLSVLLLLIISLQSVLFPPPRRRSRRSRRSLLLLSAYRCIQQPLLRSFCRIFLLLNAYRCKVHTLISKFLIEIGALLDGIISVDRGNMLKKFSTQM
jgi:hypothetical protein